MSGLEVILALTSGVFIWLFIVSLYRLNKLERKLNQSTNNSDLWDKWCTSSVKDFDEWLYDEQVNNGK